MTKYDVDCQDLVQHALELAFLFEPRVSACFMDQVHDSEQETLFLDYIFLWCSLFDQEAQLSC